jgi:hypothetical protein
MSDDRSPGHASAVAAQLRLAEREGTLPEALDADGGER